MLQYFTTVGPLVLLKSWSCIIRELYETNSSFFTKTLMGRVIHEVDLYTNIYGMFKFFRHYSLECAHGMFPSKLFGFLCSELCRSPRWEDAAQSRSYMGKRWTWNAWICNLQVSVRIDTYRAGSHLSQTQMKRRMSYLPALKISIRNSLHDTRSNTDNRRQLDRCTNIFYLELLLSAVLIFMKIRQRVL